MVITLSARPIGRAGPRAQKVKPCSFKHTEPETWAPCRYSCRTCGKMSCPRPRGGPGTSTDLGLLQLTNPSLCLQNRNKVCLKQSLEVRFKHSSRFETHPISVRSKELNFGLVQFAQQRRVVKLTQLRHQSILQEIFLNTFQVLAKTPVRLHLQQEN